MSIEPGGSRSTFPSWRQTSRRIAAGASLGGLLLCHCGAPKERLHGDQLVVLEEAVLIDGKGSSPKSDSVVVLEADRISRVGRVGQFEYPPDAEIRSVAGRWIVPGFVETHAHLSDSKSQEEILRTLVAFGITSVRVAAGNASEMVALREQISRGRVLGPRIRTAGRLLDSPQGIFSGWAAEVTTVDEVVNEIRQQAGAKVDFIKLYRGLTPDLVAAAVTEAHARGIRVIGHLGNTSWGQAAAFGIDGLEHFGIFGTPWELAPEAHRMVIKNACDRCEREDDARGLPLLRSGIRSDRSLATGWARSLVEHGVTITPNLVLLRAVLWGEDSEVLAEMEPSWAPASWRDGVWFDRVPHPYVAPCSTSWIREARATYPLFEQLIMELQHAGAILTVGTDLMNPWMTPGSSYHEEMRLLVKAGLTPSEVLVAATLNGAIAIGLEDEVGTIEPGRSADLVILKEDPLSNIGNTRTIESVFLRGIELRPADLLARP